MVMVGSESSELLTSTLACPLVTIVRQDIGGSAAGAFIPRSRPTGRYGGYGQSHR